MVILFEADLVTSSPSSSFCTCARMRTHHAYLAPFDVKNTPSGVRVMYPFQLRNITSTCLDVQENKALASS